MTVVGVIVHGVADRPQVADSAVSPAGRLSVITTARADDGPWLVTVSR